MRLSRTQPAYTDGIPAVPGTYPTLVRVRFTGLACGYLLNPKGEEVAGGLSAQSTPARVSGRRKHLLLVVVLAVKLLVPVEAGGLQGLFAGGALHTLFMPEAVVESQQKPVRDDPLTAFADRLGAHRSAYSSNRRLPMSHICKSTPRNTIGIGSGPRLIPLPPGHASPPGRSPDDQIFRKIKPNGNQVTNKQRLSREVINST